MTKEFASSDEIDDFLVKKIADVMLRKINIKKKEGYVIKILIDSYGIVDKMLERPKIITKIMKKISVLDLPNLPKNEDDIDGLGKYLKSDLQEVLQYLSFSFHHLHF